MCTSAGDFKHTRMVMQALIQLLPGCNLAHWGVNVSHGATLSHTEIGPIRPAGKVDRTV